MQKLILLITVLCTVCLSNIAFAQDRGWATAIAWSPDGETIAVASTTGLWLFDTDFNEVGHVETPEFEGLPATTIDWNASGNLIALGIATYDKYQDERSFNGKFPILVVDVTNWEVIARIKYPKLTSPIRWHPEKNLLLAGHYSGISHVLDAYTGEALFTYHESYDKLGECCNTTTAVCWLDNSTVAMVTEHEVYVLDFLAGKLLQRFSKGFVRLSRHFADCADDNEIITDGAHFVDLRAGLLSRIFSLDSTITFGDYWFHESKLAAIAYSPDGSQIVTNGNVSVCRTAVFDGQSFELRAELQGSYASSWAKDYSDSIAWHPDGSRFAIVGQFDIRMWDAVTYELLQRFDGFETGYFRLASLSEGLSEEDRVAEMNAAGIRCPELPNSMLFSR